MEIISKNIEDTRNFAKIVADKLLNYKTQNKATVLGLYGELGAGKTTFTQEFAKILGIEENIVSPTFVLEKIYKIQKASSFNHLIHIDAYRIESIKEVASLGFDELLANPDNLILIEWPERISEAMPKDHLKIFFEHLDETTRKIHLDGLE